MKDIKYYSEIFEDVDIDEKDFESIEEELSELDKERIRMNLKKSVKEDRKNKRVMRAVAIPAVVALTIGVTSIPAVAENIPFISSIYEKFGIGQEYKDYTTYIGQTIEHDGIKVTIDNIIGTKSKVAILAKVESNKELSQEEFGEIMVTCGHGGMTIRSESKDGTKLIYGEGESFGGRKTKGDLKINVSFPDGYVENISYPIDFTKAFEEIKEININKDIKELGLRVDKIESDVLGTQMYTTNFKADNFNEDIGFDTMVIKIGDKFYPTVSWGGDEINREYALSKDFYDKVKEAGEIEILPVLSDVVIEDVWSIIDNKGSNPAKGGNINYYKEIDFEDGNKGEVTKVEYVGNSVKVHYKAKTEKDSLLMGFGMMLYNNESDNKGDWKNYNPAVYKDSNGEYVAEFTDVDKNIELKLAVKPSYKFNDKSTIGNIVRCPIK